eukprot:jgi/Ulvmu1/11802/UM080_0013.1
MKVARLSQMRRPSLARKPCARLPASGKIGHRRQTAVQSKQNVAVEERLEAVKTVDIATVDAKGVPGWQQLVALSGLVAVICSVDRASISVAILPMSAEFLWDDSTKGLISSAFFVGYGVTNLVAGYVATKYPPGTVLATGVAIWSLLTILTPAAAAGSLSSLVICRLIMGLGEGVTFPCIQNLVASDVPKENKAQSLAAIYSGVQVGTVVSLLAAPLIIRAFDWQSVFYIFGSIGFVWLAAWIPVRIRQKQRAAADAVAAAAANGGALNGDGATALVDAATVAREAAKAEREAVLAEVPWRRVLTNKPFLAVFIAHAGWGFGHTIYYAWLPNFYYTEYGLPISDSAWLSALPWVCTVAVTNLGGYVADKVVNDGTMTRLRSRRIMQSLGTFLPAACLLFMAASVTGETPSVPLPVAVGVMSAALALGGLTCSGFASNHQDLTGRYAGILFGFTNAASSIAGTFSTYATGRVLYATNGNWSSVFVIIAAVYSASSLLYLLWASSDNQFDAPVEAKAVGDSS